MNLTQSFSPEDFNLKQYSLYFKEYNMHCNIFDHMEINLTFISYNNPVTGLQSLSHNLKLVDKIHKALNSKNQAVIKHVEELDILLKLIK